MKLEKDEFELINVLRWFPVMGVRTEHNIKIRSVAIVHACGLRRLWMAVFALKLYVYLNFEKKTFTTLFLISESSFKYLMNYEHHRKS